MMGNSLFWLATSSSSNFAPGSLGTLNVWVRGDSSENTMGTTVIYDDLDDAGANGGTWDAATDAQPVAVSVDGKNAAVFRGTRRANASVAASSFTLLHDASSDATIAQAVYPYEVTEGAVLWTSKTSAAGSRGLMVYVASGSIRARWSDGTTNTDVGSTVSLSANTHYRVFAGKSGTSVWISVNGETRVTGTITGSSSDAASTGYLGNNAAGTAPLNGLICESLVYADELTSGQQSELNSYLSGRWSATPSYSVHQASADVMVHMKATLGVTLGSSPDVTSWRDVSGYNNDLTATGAPEYTASWINGHPGIKATASGDYLQAGSFTGGAIAQPFTTLTAQEALGGGGTVWGEKNFTTSAQFDYTGAFDTPRLSAGSTFNGTAQTTVGGTAVSLVTVNNASSEIRTTEDGQSVKVTSGTAGTNQLDSLRLLETANAGGNPWTDFLGEFVLWGDTLSAGEKTAAESYMASEFDITAA